MSNYILVRDTYFEVGILARPASAAPGETPWRGHEEMLVALKQPLAERIMAHDIRVWSVHLPFGYGWDIAHYDEERDAVCESLKRVIDLTAAWCPRVYVLHGCLEPVAPEQRSVRVARSVRSLKELDAFASAQGAHCAEESSPILSGQFAH